jgi:hypothetical protein
VKLRRYGRAGPLAAFGLVERSIEIINMHPARRPRRSAASQSARLSASHGINGRSVEIECAGDLGKWWRPEIYGRDALTAAQVESGRKLLRVLESQGERLMCLIGRATARAATIRGRRIWASVGEWANILTRGSFCTTLWPMALMRLEPLSSASERTLARWLLRYFGTEETARRQTASGGSGPLRPTSLADAWKALLNEGLTGVPTDNPFLLDHIAQRLARAGFLIPAGALPGKSPPMGNCFYSFFALTRYENKGEAWLTRVLGWEHLLNCAGPLVCHIVGYTKDGDERGGSGLLLDDRNIVMNAHVVNDMTPRHVIVGEVRIGIEKHDPHETVDVAVVKLSAPAPYIDAGLSFRDHRAVEPILIAGYPPVPMSVEDTLTAQTGETCGRVAKDARGAQHLLFSAVARPGNSGGPVFAKDGRVVGLVSRSLEVRQTESPLPFFAAVPAATVRDAVEELQPDLEFPWETWEQ